MGPTGRFATRTLMCKDHEVATFTYDVVLNTIVGRIIKKDVRWAPLGCLDKTQAMTSVGLSRWLSYRAVPATRKDVPAFVKALGLRSTVELMFMGLGLSLSDQYWLRPNGFEGSWEDVSLFSRPFSHEVGLALFGIHNGSAVTSIKEILKSDEFFDNSPDIALNGELPKFWDAPSDEPRLVKSGSPANLMLEPYCEVAATALCERILGAEEFIPYRLERSLDGSAVVLSNCPNMVDEEHEFVPAWAIIATSPRDNRESMHDAYIRALKEHGIASALDDVEKMLVVDYLIGNFDRHWGNFGVIVETETRRWARSAPLFDMGSSLWCDRAPYPVSVASERKLAHATPFLRRPARQLERYAHDLSWLDMNKVDGFAKQAVETLALNPLTQSFPGYLHAVRNEIEQRVERLSRLQDKLTSRDGTCLQTVPNDAESSDMGR